MVLVTVVNRQMVRSLWRIGLPGALLIVANTPGRTPRMSVLERPE